MELPSIRARVGTSPTVLPAGERSVRQLGEETVSFRGQLDRLVLQGSEGLLEPADVGGGETGLLAIDVVADCGITLGVLVDGAVILQLGRDLFRLLLQGGDLL